MTGTLIGALVLVAAFTAWAIRPRRRPVVEPWERDGVEPPATEELDQAEREVRGRPALAGRDDDVPGDDWGPGASGRTRGA